MPSSSDRVVGSFLPTSQFPLPTSAIPIVAEGVDWLVVSKPPGLLVHPTKPGGPVTLVDLLRELLACELANPGARVSLVHRLDRETSGLLLAAKNPAAARRFSLDLIRGRIDKAYLALVWGWPEWETHRVDAPLLRQGTVRPSRIWLKQTIHPDGFPARTRLEVVRRCERPGTDGTARFSLVRVVTETGRMLLPGVHRNRLDTATRPHAVAEPPRPARAAAGVRRRTRHPPHGGGSPRRRHGGFSVGKRSGEFSLRLRADPVRRVGASNGELALDAPLFPLLG